MNIMTASETWLNLHHPTLDQRTCFNCWRERYGECPLTRVESYKYGFICGQGNIDDRDDWADEWIWDKKID